MYTQNHSLSTIDSNAFAYGFNHSNSSQVNTQPLVAGDKVPKFSLFIQQGIWQELPVQSNKSGIVSLDHLLAQRPLVISFYSPQSKAYGHQQIQALISLYSKIRALGGDLLVLTGESIEQIYQITAYYQLPFSIAQDPGNIIASKFGVYSLANPIWQQVAGIDQEIALPATYVIDTHSQISYAFIDADFTKELPVSNVLSAVYSLGNNQIKKVA